MVCFELLCTLVRLVMCGLIIWLDWVLGLIILSLP